MKRFARFLALLSTILLVLPIVAQDEPHPLLEMLALVPDTEFVRYGSGGADENPAFYPIIFYADYAMFEHYAPTDITINSADEFIALSEADQANWYVASLLRVVAIPSLPRPMQETGNEIDPATLSHGDCHHLQASNPSLSTRF